MLIEIQIYIASLSLLIYFDPNSISNLKVWEITESIFSKTKAIAFNFVI